MKNIFMILLAAVILFGCSKSVKNDELQIRDNGLAYAVNSNEPFSGIHKIEQYGNLLGEEEYVNGRMNGKSVYYSNNGNVTVEKHYTDGKLSGELNSYYDNGKQNCQIIFSDNQLNGEFKKWFDNGQLKHVGKIVNGNIEIIESWDNFGNKSDFPSFYASIDNLYNN